MHIRLIGPVYPYRGGIAHYTTLLAQALQDSGHWVEVVSFRRQYPAWLYPGETDRDTSRQPMRFPAEYPLDPLYPWTWFAAAHSIADAKPDLVIINWWTTFWAPAFAVMVRMLRKRGIRVAYLIHNVMPHEPRPWDRWLARLALTPADSWIAQAQREAERLRALLPSAEITITPLPVYNMFAGQPIPRAEARAILKLTRSAPVILFFGIVRPYKGLRFLLQALQILKERAVDAQLVIAGEFWEPLREYQAMIDQLELGDRVSIFPRYIPNEDVPAFFGAADVFAAPYTDGTQSASAKLALGFGLPIVLTRCIVDETLAKQEQVWIVDEGSAAALADALAGALAGGAGRPAAVAGDDLGRLVRVVEQLAAQRPSSGAG